MSGSRSPLIDGNAFRRIERSGVELTTTSAMIFELAGKWSSREGRKLIQILGEDALWPKRGGARQVNR